MQQQEQAPRMRPARVFRTVEITNVRNITPQMLRITLGGPQMASFATRGPAEHIRIFFPRSDGHAPVLPALGPNGFELAPGEERPVGRVYTPRKWDADRQELDVDVVLHGDGPGAHWAANAKRGDKAIMTGPSGHYSPNLDANWYVMAGDSAALPAICTLLDTLPTSMDAFVYAEVADASEEQPLTDRANVRVTWLHGGHDHHASGRLLESTLRKVQLPEGRGKVWVACEASVMRDIRKHLLYERKVDRGMIYTQGYWKLGTGNHSDHDLGDDV
jgi:NADPH-dependent ferric siderophore reductase